LQKKMQKTKKWPAWHLQNMTPNKSIDDTLFSNSNGNLTRQTILFFHSSFHKLERILHKDVLQQPWS
jgi:hypothetical protein